MHPRPIQDRLIEKIAEPYDGHNDCWLWTGGTAGKGYGNIQVGGRKGRKQYVHRVSYEMFVGPIPTGYHIDHLCRNRRCIRPDHLAAIPGSENSSQGNGSKTHCPAGHAYNEVNTRIYRGKRYCRACHSGEYQRRYRLRKRGGLV